jgi:hypothetical protein
VGKGSREWFSMSAVPEKKLCSSCGEDKPAAEFRKDLRRSDGLGGWCKPCVRAAARRQKGSDAAPVDEFPDDLEAATLRLAWEHLYERLVDPATLAEISTNTLAKIVGDLARLQLAKVAAGLAEPEPNKQRKVNVLEMVSGLPRDRALEVLREALPDASDPEPIRAAIAELEGQGEPDTNI